MKIIKNSKKTGISIVALVLTIIVLIILTGAVIATFMEGGILDRAKESVFKNDIRIYQEALSLKKSQDQIKLVVSPKDNKNVNATTLEDIQKIIPEFKEEYEGIVVIKNGEISIGNKLTKEELNSTEELYKTWLNDMGIIFNKAAVEVVVKVGDYVDYNIEGGTYVVAEEERNWLRNENGEDTSNAWNYDDGEEIIEYKDIMWRVLKNDGNTVTLVSEGAVYNILMYGGKGYIYGPNRLDEICNEVFGGRNLRIEDVNEILKGDRNWGEDETNWVYKGADGVIYNVPKGIKTIAMLESSTEAEAVTTIGKRNVPETGKIFGDYVPNSYNYTTSSLTNVDQVSKNMIGNGKYWLSSSSVYATFDNNCVYFNMRYINNTNITECKMYYSYGANYNSYVHGLRPVVVLSAGTEISNLGDDNTLGTKDNPWQLK